MRITRENLPLCHKIRINRIDGCCSIDVISAIVVPAVIAVNVHGDGTRRHGFPRGPVWYLQLQLQPEQAMISFVEFPRRRRGSTNIGGFNGDCSH